ncbi:MAG: hypothetical protein LC117_06665 [Bacteroidia bacterium]|nr:hypothetical protein [Bacteroidia bacterium]MCZ2277594.1 hypothetical protein [Bacteroidia bacterium]
MKNKLTPSSLILLLLSFIPTLIFAQNQDMQQKQVAAQQFLEGKQFSLLIHAENQGQAIKDFIRFENGSFETKDGKSSSAEVSRFAAWQEADGTINFQAVIGTPEGLKSYIGTIKGENITGKYSLQPANESAVSFVLNGVLNKSNSETVK